MNKNNIYKKIIQTNKDYLKENLNTDFDIKYIKEITKNINTQQITIVSGIRNIGKINTISNLIKKTAIENKCLYFNKELDTENIINSYNSLLELLKNTENTKYIFLQATGKIDGIKEFISHLYKNNYKIIIIGNDIKIPKINEIELSKNPNKENYSNILKYGFLGLSSKLYTTNYIKNYINLIIDNIILKSIIELKGVKNIYLYNNTITYLSKIDSFKSIRDLHRGLSENNEISLKTFMDYLDFSIQENIIKKVPLFDLKKNKEITSKSKYYFTDNGIRNCLNYFALDNHILRENLLFIKLNYNNFSIYGGLNGLFNFDFIAKKEKQTIYIHLSKSPNKTEIKKEINKLLKIGDDYKKYLIVENIEELGIRKRVYESLEIVSFEEIIKKDL